MIDSARIDWSKSRDGLIPAVIQDVADGSVLMLGYMNQEALEKTQSSGLVTFFSRSRRKLWTKGETSGNVLRCISMRLDCDADSLLILASPTGPTCHTGTDTCWGARRSPEDLAFLSYLESVIAERAQVSTGASYTQKLLASGSKRLAQKVGEEGLEVALAAMEDDSAHLLDEAADLIFHLLVLLYGKKLSLTDVIAVLKTRHRTTTGTPES